MRACWKGGRRKARKKGSPQLPAQDALVVPSVSVSNHAKPMFTDVYMREWDTASSPFDEMTLSLDIFRVDFNERRDRSMMACSIHPGGPV